MEPDVICELHVEPDDERFQRGVDYMLTATSGRMQGPIKQRDYGLSCLWGNILRYVIYAGQADDERAQAIIDYVIHDIHSGRCSCPHNDNFSCAWGVVRALWGLSAISPDKQSPEIQSALADGVSFLLDTFSLSTANYPTPENGKIHPLWFKLNFPLFYQTDILFTLRVLADLNVLDHARLTSALDWLEAQRNQQGYWRGRSPYRSRTWRELGNSEDTSRWVSLQSAWILQKAGRLEFNKSLEK